MTHRYEEPEPLDLRLEFERTNEDLTVKIVDPEGRAGIVIVHQLSAEGVYAFNVMLSQLDSLLGQVADEIAARDKAATEFQNGAL